MSDLQERPRVPFAPLIVGLPRTGFSLIGSVLTNIFQHTYNKFGPKHKIYQIFATDIGQCFGRTVDNVFLQHNLEDALLLNDNFRHLCGGPIWNNDSLGPKAYFRKYIGVRNHGDLTLVIALPLQLLDQYELIHSHGPFRDWSTLQQYENYQKFSSIRNPPGTINSACHSINALASEYIQRSPKITNVGQIRQDLAYYKLTDLKFFDALLQPMKRGMTDQLSQKQYYHTIAWEDLITKPRETIEAIVEELQIPMEKSILHHIWDSISYRNLTGSHRHNYREGKAYVGDEREALVNQHLDIMREAGLEDIALEFGYKKWQYMKVSHYTEFQKNVSSAIERNQILDPCPDRFLFDLAFNKSNIDFAAFGFRQHDWLKYVRLERSNLKTDDLEIDLAQKCNQTIQDLTRAFKCLEHDLQQNDFDWAGTKKAFKDTNLPISTEEINDFFSKISYVGENKKRPKGAEKNTQFGKPGVSESTSNIATYQEPRLIEENYRNYNLVAYNAVFFAIHQAIGPVELDKIDLQSFKADQTIVFNSKLSALKQEVDSITKKPRKSFLARLIN